MPTSFRACRPRLSKGRGRRASAFSPASVPTRVRRRWCAQPSGSPIVERALAVAREASVDLREIVSGIEPDALRELGLAAAIAELTERHTQRRGVAFDLDIAAANDLGEGAQSGLYQIVRDALDQAVRRGPPDNVVVSIVPSDGGAELTIADDGAQERRAAVLAALGERVAELNGTFSSETNDAGTRISIRLPPSAARL